MPKHSAKTVMSGSLLVLFTFKGRIGEQDPQYNEIVGILRDCYADSLHAAA
ncbi:hypothetical protein [Thaumasiovibrio sp. DFM-14]|uniref:hypothetical protein n=1 Tax=Thaumasiovibrio sp. DFM-14 TaxID=3384792 RepID=UPI0039A20F09